MLLQRCVNCGDYYGVKEEKENHERVAEITGITSGFCPYCWLLWIDAKKYDKFGLPLVASYLRAVLKARSKEVKKK